jgi:predicted flavoprotein YhiN
VEQATKHGAQLLTDWELATISRARNGFRLRAANGDEVDADKIVVATGGWLPHLLADLPLPTDFRARAAAVSGQPGAGVPLPVSRHHHDVADLHSQKPRPDTPTACPAAGMPGSAARSSPSSTEA